MRRATRRVFAMHTESYRVQNYRSYISESRAAGLPGNTRGKMRPTRAEEQRNGGSVGEDEHGKQE